MASQKQTEHVYARKKNDKRKKDKQQYTKHNINK